MKRKDGGTYSSSLVKRSRASGDFCRVLKERRNNRVIVRKNGKLVAGINIAEKSFLKWKLRHVSNVGTGWTMFKICHASCYKW